MTTSTTPATTSEDPRRNARAVMGPSDKALWTRALVGDTLAFTALVRRHQSPVRGFLRRLSGDAGVADDLAQETFLKAHSALATWRGERAMTPWLLSIAWRLWLSDRRKVRHQREVVDDEAGAAAAAPRGVERTSRDAERDVQRALMTLSEDERACIAMCFQDELTHEEAAVALAMPLGTVKSHLARGKAKLRTVLAAYATPKSEAA